MLPVNIFLYNESKRQWTGTGNCYMRQLLAANPLPSRAEKQQIMVNAGIISYCVINSKIKNTKTQQRKQKVVAAVIEEEELGCGQNFLKSITMHGCKKLYNDMEKNDTYVRLINVLHVKPALTKEELKHMTGPQGLDGSHFVDWLSSLITERDFLSRPAGSFIDLSRNTKSFPSVRDKINEHCKKFEKRHFDIPKHHVVLRTKEDDLPVLSQRSGSMAASHLCDTTGCILKDHIVLESMEINRNRAKCAGIILTVCPATTTSPAHILKATACQHGLNHKDSNGDNFMFS